MYKPCIRCQKVFYVRPSNPKSLYCSIECLHEAIGKRCKECGNRTIKKRSYCEKCRTRRKSWKDPILLKCEYCFRLFVRRKGSVDRGRKRFCSTMCYQKSVKRDGNPNWKGGIKSITKRLRDSDEMKSWVNSIMEMDKYTCCLCGQKGGKLQVHHIFPFQGIIASYIGQYGRLDYDGLLKYPAIWTKTNGATLCKSCHNLFPKRLNHGAEVFIPLKLLNRFKKGAICFSSEEFESGVVSDFLGI